MTDPEQQAPPGGGGPPPDPFFVNPIFYIEDDADNALDWSQAGTAMVRVTRWHLQKNDNGEAVITLRIEEPAQDPTGSIDPSRGVADPTRE